MRVLIIGAGLGGLCLAHGLRRAGLDVQVFERRPSPHDQPASYGIHLNADGLRALHACLPAESWQQLVRDARPARDIVRFSDARLRTLATHDRETPENASDPITRRRAVSRDALRDALLRGLNLETRSDFDVLQWGKEFVSYELGASGAVEVRFSDGSSTLGDLLIGADGSKSKLRRQRLPSLDRVDLNVLSIAGRAPMTPVIEGQLPGWLIDGSINNVVPKGRGWLFVSTWQVPDAGQSIVWAWAAARRSYASDVDQWSPSALRDHVLGCLQGWAPGLSHLVSSTPANTVARVPLRTMPHLTPWTPSAVTLLGDAIHNMTPMAGVGANTALRDADELRRALLRSSPGQEQSLVSRVHVYEQRMRVYANDALAQSTRNALNAATEAPLSRALFRALLGLGTALPAVQPLIFGAEAAAPRTASVAGT